ncbi:MAG: NACHT domain-containing protein [Desulfobacteraceae bacterium]|nr:NACHT domain-containing protein [Desulfobacteraceae bacterium]
MQGIICLEVNLVGWYNEQEEQLEKEYKENRITFPEPLPPENPHLHDRIKELFEIKLKKYDLKLKQSANKENVLYGYYEDDFDRIIWMIYCDDRKDIIVSEAEQIEVYSYFQNEVKPAISKDTEKGIRDYPYYILTSGTFESKADLKRFTVQTEDEFLNSIIDFKKYLRDHLLSNYNNSKIFSSIKKEEDKKTLADTFIAPSFYIGDEKSETCEDLKGYIDKWLTNTSEQKHLILLGDYGMGKTSFFKYYSATLAKEILNGKPFKRFPVFISLTNTSPRHGGINQTIKAFVAEHLGVEYALFEKLVQKGKILFLLDAFDEMGYIGTHEQRFKQFNEIWQLAVSNNKIMLSGRPSYFPTEFELKSILNIPKKGHETTQVRPYSEKLVLNPLDDTRIKEYIGKYYTDNEVKIYLDWIKNNDSIHELCRRPSMMHIIREIIPELYKQNENKLINASDVFEQYINFWFDRQEEKGVPSVFEKYSPEKKSLILSFYKELASDFHLSRILKAKSETIIEKLHSIIDAKGIKGFDKKEFIEGFEAEILTGYFIEIEDDEYKFVHKSFYEYFLANKIIELIKKSELNHDLISDDWLPEVVDFIYDAIPEEYKSHDKIPALYLMLLKTGKNKYLIIYFVPF